jgi:hypothetical protein
VCWPLLSCNEGSDALLDLLKQAQRGCVYCTDFSGYPARLFRPPRVCCSYECPGTNGQV